MQGRGAFGVILIGAIKRLVLDDDCSAVPRKMTFEQTDPLSRE
jgi:hypothetical protein